MRSHQGAFPQAHRGYVEGTQRRGGRTGVPDHLSAPQGERLRQQKQCRPEDPVGDDQAGPRIPSQWKSIGAMPQTP